MEKKYLAGMGITKTKKEAHGVKHALLDTSAIRLQQLIIYSQRSAQPIITAQREQEILLFAQMEHMENHPSKVSNMQPNVSLAS